MQQSISASVDRALIRQYLQEDVGSGDVTAKVVTADVSAKATVINREAMILCGQLWFDAVFDEIDSGVKITWFYRDGDSVFADQVLCEINGPARALLTAERTALNLLQTLSGTATSAKSYADAVAGTQCKILDTRKTIPGLRLAQKYAVRCGGGYNHRIGLYDAILIKENHIKAAGSIALAVKQAMSLSQGQIPIEVEVESLDELHQAIAAGAPRLLLDNFTLEQLKQAVSENAGRVLLEASGNMSLETIRAVAETGVDYISVGAITKHMTAIDLSMRINLLLND